MEVNVGIAARQNAVSNITVLSFARDRPAPTWPSSMVGGRVRNKSGHAGARQDADFRGDVGEGDNSSWAWSQRTTRLIDGDQGAACADGAASNHRLNSLSSEHLLGHDSSTIIQAASCRRDAVRLDIRTGSWHRQRLCSR